MKQSNKKPHSTWWISLGRAWPRALDGIRCTEADDIMLCLGEKSYDRSKGTIYSVITQVPCHAGRLRQNPDCGQDHQHQFGMAAAAARLVLVKKEEELWREQVFGFGAPDTN